LAVATDGKHLAVQEGQGVCVGKHKLGWKTTGDEPRMVYPIIPTATLKHVLRVLKEQSIKHPGYVKMAFIASKKDSTTKTNVFLECGDAMIVSHVLDARTPPWHSVVADAGGMPCAMVDSGKLLAAVKDSGIVSTPAYTYMSLTFQRNKMLVAGRTKGGTTVESTVPMPVVGGDLLYQRLRSWQHEVT
jgi:hypothetical protein